MKNLIFFGLLSVFSLNAAPLVQNIQPIRDLTPPVTVEFDSVIKEVVLSPGKTVKFDEFKLTLKQTIKRAKGMQAAGEWRSLLEKCAIPTQQTSLAVGFDGKILSLHIICSEKFMDRVISLQGARRDSNVAGNDCIDLIISPNRKGLLYYQIIVDSDGNIYDARNRIDGNKRVADKSWNPDFKATGKRFADHWEVDLAFPLEIFNLSGAAGEFIDLNVSRNELAFREASSLNQVNASFHELDKLVRFYFGTKKESAHGKLKGITLPAPEIGLNSGEIKIDKETKNARIEVTVGQNIQTFRVKKHTAKITLPFDRAGAAEVKVKLLSGEKEIDSAVIPVVVPDPLIVQLQQTEFSGDAVIPGEIKVAVSPRKDYLLRFSLGKDRFELQDIPKRFTFELNAKHSGSFLIELVNRQSGQCIGKKVFNLTRTVDMFAE